MIIPCTTSIVTEFQVLDPEPVVPPGNVIGQYVETGSKQLAVGVQDYTVTFTTAKISAAYIFDAATIRNDTDFPAAGLGFEITAKSTTAFSFSTTNGVPETVNTFFDWAVRIII